jgi:hypothetical protein
LGLRRYRRALDIGNTVLPVSTNPDTLKHEDYDMNFNIDNSFSRLSLTEIRDLIVADARCGARATWGLFGEPGIGKSAMYKDICRILDYPGVFIDAPSTDVSDIGIPVPNHETKTTTLYPNGFWGFDPNVPMVIFIDEFSKASKPVQNVLHGLLTHPRRLGSMLLHPECVVIVNGNLQSDNVGDNMLGHTLNRITRIVVAKPDNEEWCDWAASAGCHPAILLFAKNNPRAFKSYLDADFAQMDSISQEMVFWPNPPSDHAVAKLPKSRAVFTPRSAEMASNILYAKDEGNLPERTLLAALQGTIGNAAARELLACYALRDDTADPREIVSNPHTARVPVSPAAQIYTTYNASHWMTSPKLFPDTQVTRMEVMRRIDAWFTYTARCGTPACQAMFVNQVMRAAKNDPQSTLGRLGTLCGQNDTFRQWAAANSYMY